MMKPKDKPYFADTLPFLMLSRWFDDENLSLVFQKCLEPENSCARPSLSELNSLLEKEGVDLEVEEKR